ncbi:FecR family protein [Pareuzebyella sediminis]|uniref:FecR family protein n=1 Tax=Pareuzebyella sediminis TaxID=2607998 RepID=UPI0011F087C3|nr:FecR family protein [Pareuzebyella sediminis]
MSKHLLLIDRFLEGSISPDERIALKNWVLESESNMDFFKKRIKESSQDISFDFDSDSAYQKFLKSLESGKKSKKHVQKLLKYAAILAILLTSGIYINRQLKSSASTTPIKVVESKETPKTGQEIMITFSDGNSKTLSSDATEKVTDSKGNIIASQRGNSLKFGGQKETRGSEELYNEIYIPFGQTFKLVLSDGTLVWLNAGSKLRFPTSFNGSEKTRTVYLDGEAYLEVVTNKQKPFIVNTQEVGVKVLGTKFNIASYDTDDYIATTLVEGSVNVYETRAPENAITLSPNFQAKYQKIGNNFSTTLVDTDVFTSWMRDRLIIDNLKFSEILAKLERKYFVQFINKAGHLNNEVFKGEFVDEDIESVLKTISLSTPFNYEINQNTITITP